MQVILHTGVHCTDDDKLLKCLLRNADDWRHEGVAVPGPGKYRQLLSAAITSMATATPAEDARDVLLDAILSQDVEQVRRLVLSHENFFSVPKLLLGGGRFYRKAEMRLQQICELFQGDEVQLFMGLRNPATHLPAVFDATPHDAFDDFLNGTDPQYLLWSDLLLRIREAVPHMPITVWANEDTPLIWGEIVRRMAGIALGRKIVGAFDIFSEIIAPEGMKRFRAFLAQNPDITEAQKRRAMIAFLDKYALEGAMEEELDLPGWDAPYVDALTRTYEADLLRIAQMDGVRMIAP